MNSTTTFQHGILCVGTVDFPRADTASVVQLGDGSILAAFQRYRASAQGGHDDGVADIVMARSSDGVRWSQPTIIVSPNAQEISVLIPALTRLASGRLLLICTHMLPGVNTGTRYGATTARVLRSDNDGATWHAQGTVWENVSGTRFQGGACGLLRCASGRLLYPWHQNVAPGRWSDPIASGCAHSDDEGVTWVISDARIELPGRGALEPSVVELPNGECVMSLRTTLGHVYLSRSHDQGTTWSTPEPTSLVAPQAATCLRILPGTASIILLWNDAPYQAEHHHHGERTPLSAARSDDSGHTWQRLGNIRHTPGAECTNPGLLFLASGDALVTYWHVAHAFSRAQSDCAVTRIPAAWFTST